MQTIISSISDITTGSHIERLLTAAISKITTESQTDKHPEEVLQQLIELESKIFTETTEELPISEEPLSAYYREQEAAFGAAERTAPYPPAALSASSDEEE